MTHKAQPHTFKNYKCSQCGHIMQIKTNHFGACWSWGHYNTCPNCPPYKKYPEFGGHTLWECQDSPLFCGVYPEGLVWSDRTREENGDYKKLAFLGFRKLELTLYDDNMPAEFLDYIKRQAASLQRQKGERFDISESGQYIILGCDL